VLLGHIISRFFACSNEEKNKQKHQRVLALVLSLGRDKHSSLLSDSVKDEEKKVS
jgi:hypothetical protein